MSATKYDSEEAKRRIETALCDFDAIVMFGASEQKSTYVRVLLNDPAVRAGLFEYAINRLHIPRADFDWLERDLQNWACAHKAQIHCRYDRDCLCFKADLPTDALACVEGYSIEHALTKLKTAYESAYAERLKTAYESEDP